MMGTCGLCRATCAEMVATTEAAEQKPIEETWHVYQEPLPEIPGDKAPVLKIEYKRV